MNKKIIELNNQIKKLTAVVNFLAQYDKEDIVLRKGCYITGRYNTISFIYQGELFNIDLGHCRLYKIHSIEKISKEQVVITFRWKDNNKISYPCILLNKETCQYMNISSLELKEQLTNKCFCKGEN